MLIKRHAINAVLPAVTSDDMRYFLKAVAIEPDGRLVATNGHVLLMASDSEQREDADFPIVPGAEFHGNRTGQTLVDGDVLKALVSAMAKKTTIPVLDCVQLGSNGSDTTAQLAVTDLQSPRIAIAQQGEQTFPAYDRVIPSADQPTRLVLSVEVLETLVKAAKAVNNKAKKIQTITFAIPANDKAGYVVSAVHVSMTGADGVSIKGAAMPCRP